MPSYKEKYTHICNRLTTMERRVLLDETILLELRQTVLDLQVKLNAPPKEIDEFMLNQLHLALTELIRYASPQFQLPAHFKGKEITEILTTTTEMIFNVVSLLRDATVRAQTILSDISPKQSNEDSISKRNTLERRYSLSRAASLTDVEKQGNRRSFAMIPKEL